jgi:hypothetical protein
MQHRPVWGRGTCRFVVGKLEGKRELRKSRRKYEHNIHADFVEIAWEGALAGLIWLSTGQVAGCYECVNEPLCCMKCRVFLNWLRT